MFRAIGAVAVLWLVALILAPLLPAPFSTAIYVFGSFICHQRPERSFDLAGIQLPVCARCLGLYGGAALGSLLAVAVGTVRRPRRVILLSILPAVISLLVEWSGLAQPGNVVRALTGLLAGGVIAAVVLATLHYEQCVPQRPIAPNRPPTPI